MKFKLGCGNVFDKNDDISKFINEGEIEITVIVKIKKQCTGSRLRSFKISELGEGSRRTTLLPTIIDEEVPIAKKAGG